MNLSPVAIVGRGVLCAAGKSSEAVHERFVKGSGFFVTRQYGEHTSPVAALHPDAEDLLSELIGQNQTYQKVDRTAHIAMAAAERALASAGWSADESSAAGINVGSSRGATGLLEQGFRAYIDSETDRVSPFTSPTTTPGNISSWVGQHLRLTGHSFDHSVTCSSGLYALGNGCAWVRSGMTEKFLCGAVEAPLTGFTIAQMKALRIYTSRLDDLLPSRPCEADATECTMALGEGGAIFALEPLDSALASGRTPLAVIEAFGTGVERINSPTSLSNSGEALQQSMQSALGQLPLGAKIDAVVMHAPGTLGGDGAEVNAITRVFDKTPPYLVSQKWLTGHTLGAAGALGVDLALSILKSQESGEFPYQTSFRQSDRPSNISRVMVNAVGFGGNAASIVLLRREFTKHS